MRTPHLTPPGLPHVQQRIGAVEEAYRGVAVNYLGLCAITMPVGRDRAGMPIGLQLTAPAFAEERLLAIALAVERVLGTAADRLGTPPLLAS
jgi:aspartyl-tRNA(Asn)/glutamyl-tRNA(Gln) amidotransferase subunit A